MIHYTKWTHIDDTEHEVDTGVGDDHDATDDDDFDYQELLHHVEP
jgi:hypothetical protein